jgi:4a-hydroxytetrahydrobiopterin dehydratase
MATQAGTKSETAGASATASTPLTERRCVACEGGTPALKPEEIEPLLRQVKGWEVEEGKRLVKSFKFPNFVKAVDFVNAITPVAEGEGHHPDLLVRWGEVRAILWTHAANGLTENDFILAAKIDALK